MKAQLLALTFLLGSSLTAKAEMAHFLFNDKEALQARADLMQQAKKEILVEYYAVTDDDTSTRGIALLCEASKRGVQVKVILDAISSTVKDYTIAATQKYCKDKAGKTNIEFRLFNPIDISSIHDILNRTHDKMIAIDGKYLIIGGRNVADKYFGLHKKRNFKDLDILLSGKITQDARLHHLSLWDKTDIVRKFNYEKFEPENLKKFCNSSSGSLCQKTAEKGHKENMAKVKAANERMQSLLKVMISGKGNTKWNSGTDWSLKMKEVNGVRLLANSTAKNVNSKNMDISNELYKLISNAQRKVLILSPYLIPTKRAKTMFENLIARGVQVTIITNSLKSTDNLFAQAGYKAAKDQMVEMGIELYEYNLYDTSHAKAAVVDDETVLIGTYNLDPRSSNVNREIGIAIKDNLGSGLADELTAIINTFKSQSVLVGLNGKHVNEHLQNSDVSTFKKGAVQILETTVPLIKSQL